jgi:DNA-binding IclR family transcriptional regulator
MTSRVSAPPIADLAAVCAALADPTRLDIPQPTASRHLAYLRRAGLVEGRRDGLWVHYRLAPELSPPVRHAVEAVVHAARHAAEPSADGRQLARATGQPVRTAMPMVTGCCAPPIRSRA